jgi:hypothetical protein
MEQKPSKRGRPPDPRPQLEIRVQQEVYELLIKLQSDTGLTVEQVAGMLLHMLLRDPDGIANRLRVLAQPANKPE